MDVSNVSLISENYKASLRVIELPDDSNVFLWDRFPQLGERLCILNIFEGIICTKYQLVSKDDLFFVPFFCFSKLYFFVAVVVLF